MFYDPLKRVFASLMIVPSWNFFSNTGVIPELQVYQNDQWTRLQFSDSEFKTQHLFFNPLKNFDHFLSNTCHMILGDSSKISVLNSFLIGKGSRFRIVDCSSQNRDILLEWYLDLK